MEIPTKPSVQHYMYHALLHVQAPMGGLHHAPPYKERDLFTRLARKLGFSNNVITHSEIANVVKRMRENALQGKHEAKTQAHTQDGGRYSKSDPDTFVPDENGNIDYGEITPEIAKEIGRQAGKIRLRHGDDAHGAKHIDQKHGEQLKRYGYTSAYSFVSDVAQSYNGIYQGKSGSLILVKKNGKNKIAFVKLAPGKGGDYYSVESAFIARKNYFDNKKSLWEGANFQHSPEGTPNAISGQSDSKNKIADKNKSDKGRYRTAEPTYKQHIGPKAVDKENNYLTKLEQFITKFFDSQYALLKLEQGLDLI